MMFSVTSNDAIRVDEMLGRLTVSPDGLRYSSINTKDAPKRMTNRDETLSCYYGLLDFLIS